MLQPCENDIKRTQTTTMTEGMSSLRTNRIKNFMSSRIYATSARLQDRLQVNEWSFSFLLFIISLSIVLGKLYINYGNISEVQNNIKYTPASTYTFSNISHFFNLSYLLDKSQPNVSQAMDMNKVFVNINHYENVVNVITLFFKTYGWLIRAIACSLVMVGFTWFIIYKDSSIPGINPPSPISPFKQRFPETLGIQMNYMIGIINGILLFIYMCL